MCEVCHWERPTRSKLICDSCIGDHQYVGDVKIFDRPGSAFVHSDGHVEFFDPGPLGTYVRVRVRPAGRKPIFDVLRRDFLYFDRNQREVSTYLYDRAHRRFEKRHQDAATGELVYGPVSGDLENQDLHGESGKRRRK